MDSSAQIGLHAGCNACGGFKRGCSPGFADNYSCVADRGCPPSRNSMDHDVRFLNLADDFHLMTALRGKKVAVVSTLLNKMLR